MQVSRALASLPSAVRLEVEALLSSKQVSSSKTDLEAHGRDESYHRPAEPQLVTYPETTKQVSDLLKLCNRTGTPVVPFGAGTSVEGHVMALKGGICMDLSRMNRIIEINELDFNCKVESGVTREALNNALRATGLFFSVDPGANATLGGMMATRASGTNTVKFGTMRENLLGCTVVLANGEIVKTGSQAIKSSAGYDLTHLLCGSEGTLGVMTEIMVKLRAHPETTAAAVCEFPSMKAAVDSATAVIQNGVPVSRIELLDELSLSAVNTYSKMKLSLSPTLFFEFHGTDASVTEQSSMVAEIVKDFNGSEFEWETTTEGRDRLWKARHTAYWATLQSYPKCKGYITDVCVPISKLAECIVHAQKLASDRAIPAPIVGHVGDGNFHAMMMVDAADPNRIALAKRVSDDIILHALSCGGTCTGEHGIGSGKLDFLEQEHGRSALNMMHSIKQALDPNNILNPGKLGSDFNLQKTS